MKHSEAFIKNTLALFRDKIIFCGSYALKVQKMITREHSDYDIIMDEALFNQLNFNGLEMVEWCYQSWSNRSDGITWIHTCRFKDNSKIDFILRTDVATLKTSTHSWIIVNMKCLNVIDIVREKINLIEKDHNKEKHIEDIISVMESMRPWWKPMTEKEQEEFLQF